jgi:hypothetical protein
LPRAESVNLTGREAMYADKARLALRATLVLTAAGLLLAACEKDMNADGTVGLDYSRIHATAAMYGWSNRYASVALDERRPNSDVALLIKVKSALMAEPSLKPFALEAGVLNGAVTLYGEVDTVERRAIAERITRGVRGVAEVKSGIVVMQRA